MNWPSLGRWNSLWRTLADVNPPPGWYERLAAAYAEPHRHYHNQQHVAECLASFDEANQTARQPAVIELALWFHDAVYDPKAADNEERSTALLRRCATEGGLDGSTATTAAELVLTTKQHEPGPDSDAALMIDIDLSILGRDEARYAEYEQQIRQEYSWVPATLFASKRAEILGRFLARPSVFQTGRFRERYKIQARQNLNRSIQHLLTSSG